ncbi:MAG TPA: hypothetical protein P5081_14715 [Phycisphaerae bacterium]|nr:hypothetical protein [Phycisphaerae bacterium]HRW54123.1 hypothetical protein [Phycisphaerae bacterium]
MLCALWPQTSTAAERHPTIEKGNAHPYFAAKAVDAGEPFVLDAHRGRKVVMLHVAPWDAGVVAQLPEWEAFAKRCAESEIDFVGVIQELHFDRAALFAKWKKIGFPAYHDPLNQADARRVGRAVCVDEFGIVRAIAKTPAEVSETFVAKAFKGDRSVMRPPFPETPKIKLTKRRADEARRCLEYIEHGDACMFDPEPVLIAEAIDAYGKAVQSAPREAAAAFRLGVAHLIRFYSDGGSPGDLRSAMDALSVAASLDPKNQVFSERLGQFAATSDKRIDSCGWIAEAMRATGVATLRPPPAAIEAAAPSASFKACADSPASPADITPNATALRVESAVVRTPQPKVPGLVNVLIDLAPGSAAIDNGKPIKLWLIPPEGVSLERRLVESAGARRVLLSVAAQLPPGASGDTTLKCVAVFESSGATTRCDFEITIPAKTPELIPS